MQQAKLDFWDAFQTGKMDAVPAARDAMLAAFDPSSGDFEGARFIGMSYILTAAASARPQFIGSDAGGPPRGPSNDVTDAFQNAVKYTTLAANMAPSNTGVIDLGHEADALYAQGVVMRDQSTADKGRELLAQVTTAYPIYGYLTRAPVYTAQPVGSTDFAVGLESLYAMFEACTNTKIDREHPDVSAMLGDVTDRHCGNSEAHIPHNLEGTLLMFGDTLVKIGKPDDARRVFQTVTKTRDYPNWAFRSDLEARLASDLTTIPASGQSCLTCHQR
jgi:hypothetical protein